MKRSIRVISISGGSGSGKTTFAQLLKESINSSLGQNSCEILAQDSYYIDQSAIFRGDGENVNFDHPNSLDFPLLGQHLSELVAGRSVPVPIYDFVTHTRRQDTIRLDPVPVLLVDGTLVLSQDQLRPWFEVKIFIDAPEEVRFARRLHRDTHERGRTPEGVYKQFTRQVKPMHDAFIEPSKVHAEKIFSGQENFSDSILGVVKAITGISNAR